MKFDPDAKINEENSSKEREVLKPGEYSFMVVEAEEKESKQGNQMLALKLKVYGEGTDDVNVWDYITAKMTWKLKQICLAIGMEEEFRSGDISPQQFVNRPGALFLDVETSEKYGSQNKVKKYVPLPKKEEAPEPVNETPRESGDPIAVLPF